MAIAKAEGETVPEQYTPIQHPSEETFPFFNLNGSKYDVRKEQPKRETAKFKYHIPYLIINAYRVELTNYRSDFERGQYLWETEIHYSQGRMKAKAFAPNITMWAIPSQYKDAVRDFIMQTKKSIPSMNKFQSVFCMTGEQRSRQKYFGPYELLEKIKDFIETTFSPEAQKEYVHFGDEPTTVPMAIAAGYLILKRLLTYMGR